MTMKLNNEQIELLNKEFMTGYQVSKLTSTLVGRYVREQMVYNYINKGFIPSVLVEGSRRVTQEGFRTWFTKFGTKNGVKVSDIWEQVS